MRYTSGKASVDTAIRTLRRSFAGALYVPGDAGYDIERLGWDRSIDSRPAIVATAASVADVQAAVMAAQEHDLPLVIQATGHGTVVASDGALLLKTSQMTTVEIDPDR